jgi:hypothetical protein
MRTLVIGLVGALSMAAGPLAAQDNGAFDIWSGNGYLRNCSAAVDSENAFRLGVCFGYLDGWLERDSAFDKQRLVCRPQTANNQQLMDVVLKYLRDNPQDRHKPIAQHLLNSLPAAFPCLRAAD